MLLTRAPVASRGGRSLPPDAPRLACVKPAASVHPEPGSNSPLFYIFSDLLLIVLSVRPPVCPKETYMTGDLTLRVISPCLTVS